MSVATDLVVPALRDVRDTQTTVADTFQAHIAITPAGPHRQMLQRHAADARDRTRDITERLDRLQPRGPLPHTLDQIRRLAGQAVRIAWLPWRVAATVPAAALSSRGRIAAHELLKNTEDEYTITAKAVASSRAGEHIAHRIDDSAVADLLGSIRSRDEEFLDTLGRRLEEHATAVVRAITGSPEGNGTAPQDLQEGAREGVRRLWETAERHTGPESAEQEPGAPRQRDRSEGAVVTADRLPIRDYDTRSESRIVEQLPVLPQSDLATVEEYEQAHAHRSAILDRIAELRRPEPWPGYDTMEAGEIRTRLRKGDPDLARRVFDYERRHRQRPTVTTAAAERFH